MTSIPEAVIYGPNRKIYCSRPGCQEELLEIQVEEPDERHPRPWAWPFFDGAWTNENERWRLTEHAKNKPLGRVRGPRRMRITEKKRRELRKAREAGDPVPTPRVAQVPTVIPFSATCPACGKPNLVTMPALQSALPGIEIVLTNRTRPYTGKGDDKKFEPPPRRRRMVRPDHGRSPGS
jgi:hypothetical protein